MDTYTEDILRDCGVSLLILQTLLWMLSIESNMPLLTTSSSLSKATWLALISSLLGIQLCFAFQDEPAKPTPKKQKVSTSQKSAAKQTPSKKAVAGQSSKPSNGASDKVPVARQGAKGKGSRTSQKAKKAQQVTSDSDESESQESESEFSGQEVRF